MTDPIYRHTRGLFSRRILLRGATAAGLGLSAPRTGLSQPFRVQDASGPLRYAVIGDTHIMPVDESRAFHTSRIFAWLEALDPEPAFIVHIGDLTEAGFQVEYEQYASLIPDRFRDRIFHVPGNREVQWDEYGKRTFVEWYGQAPYSFDANGIHFVALDATIILQPLGQFGGDQIGWLRDDLEQIGPEIPVVLFFHYPVGGAYYYVTDQDALYDAIAPYNVIAIHAGHVHRESVRYVNGVVQATMRAAKDGAFLHMVDQQGDSLMLSALEVLDTGEVITEPVATIPLGNDARISPGEPNAAIEPLESGDAVNLSVPAVLAPGASEVTVRAWPNHLFSTRDSDKLGWVPLAPDNPAAPTMWQGAIPLANMVPGRDRIEMSAIDPQGMLWQRAFPVTIALDGQPAVIWEEQVTTDAIQASLIVLPTGEVVIAATDGDVAAFIVSPDGVDEIWRLPGEGGRTGIVSTPTVTSDGTVVVGRLSGALEALYPDGSPRWQALLPMPVLADITSLDVDGAGLLITSSGGTIHALDVADGSERWQNGSSMFTGGRPTTDLDSVYASFADGTLRAFSLNSGEEQWQVTTFSSPDIYSLVARSGWSHSTGLVSGEEGTPARVITGTEQAATGHDAVSGLTIWELAGPYMHAAPLLLDNGMLVLAATDGTVSCVEPVTGQVNWQVSLGYSIFTASPLQYGDLVLVPGAGAQLAALHAETGDVIHRLQLGGTALFSTPIIVGDVLVSGGEDGKLRGVLLSTL